VSVDEYIIFIRHPHPPSRAAVCGGIYTPAVFSSIIIIISQFSPATESDFLFILPFFVRILLQISTHSPPPLLLNRAT